MSAQSNLMESVLPYGSGPIFTIEEYYSTFDCVEGTQIQVIATTIKTVCHSDGCQNGKRVLCSYSSPTSSLESSEWQVIHVHSAPYNCSAPIVFEVAMKSGSCMNGVAMSCSEDSQVMVQQCDYNVLPSLTTIIGMSVSANNSCVSFASQSVHVDGCHTQMIESFERITSSSSNLQHAHLLSILIFYFIYQYFIIIIL